MEKQHEIYDTIAVMNGYNFDKPINISVIIEDNEREPNQSKVSDYGNNNFLSTNLQYGNRYKNYAMQQQNSCIRNKPRRRSEINLAQRFSYNGSERNLDGSQRHISSNNVVNTSTYTDNFHSCRGLVSENNNTREKSLSLYNAQQIEFIMINTVAENLALIMESYVHFCTLISKSKDAQYISHLRAKCLRVKLSLFYKCMVMSKGYLLQQQNNQQFIAKLLQRAKQMSKVTLPNKHYEHLYEDMLKWIRLKTSKMTKNYQNTINNENFATHMVHQTSNPVSEPMTENRPATNIFSSGPLGSQVTISIDTNILEQQIIKQNMLDNATEDPSYLQPNNIEMHHYSHSNNSPLCENSQQNKQPNAPWLNSTYCTQAQYAQNNTCNTRFTAINQVDSQDTTRSSISRDSGFISPVMPVSPSEYYINNVQQPSIVYNEQRTIYHGMPNTTALEPNVAVEDHPFWSNV